MHLLKISLLLSTFLIFPLSSLSSISFYNASPTTAASVASYVNSNLSNYIIASLVNDGGNSGAGIINLSTYEDSNFTTQNIQLVDGINWVLSSNLKNIISKM